MSSVIAKLAAVMANFRKYSIIVLATKIAPGSNRAGTFNQGKRRRVVS
ncbi:MAG TPA: hypothetical protein VEU51_03580 [Candidatus Acidoferrales bacterium]|nr:hypothetical protein [Candidatus Acidoferrales bacterium]